MKRTEQARKIYNTFKNNDWKLKEEDYENLKKELGSLDSWYSVFSRDCLFKLEGYVCVRKNKNTDAQNYLSYFINKED